MPALREVATDVCLPVRVALASSAMDLAAKMPPAYAPVHIIPLAMQLLRDESAEVRVCRWVVWVTRGLVFPRFCGVWRGVRVW